MYVCVHAYSLKIREKIIVCGKDIERERKRLIKKTTIYSILLNNQTSKFLEKNETQRRGKGVDGVHKYYMTCRKFLYDDCTVVTGFESELLRENKRPPLPLV